MKKLNDLRDVAINRWVITEEVSNTILKLISVAEAAINAKEVFRSVALREALEELKNE